MPRPKPSAFTGSDDLHAMVARVAATRRVVEANGRYAPAPPEAA